MNNSSMHVFSNDTSWRAGGLSRIIEHMVTGIQAKEFDDPGEKKITLENLEFLVRRIVGPFNPKPKMCFENFNFDCIVGFGSYGRIWKADGVHTGTVAIKQQPATQSDVQCIWKERDILVHLKHERICNLIGAFYHVDAFLVMELCYGSVAFLRNRITSLNAARFSHHLLEAIDWIHSKDIIHADVKPDNCLINTNNNLVLSDFGSAILLTEGEESMTMTESHGSPGYLDLEANKNLRFSKSTDLFSMACVIFEMDTKSHLLFYNTHDHPRDLYIDALEHGRVRGLPPNTKPTSGMERQLISERVMASYFGPVLKDLVSPNSTLSASQLKEDPNWYSTLNSLGLDIFTNSGVNIYVTKEFNLDQSYSFNFFGDEDDPLPNLAMLPFYYDEGELDVGNDHMDTASDTVDSEGDFTDHSD